MTDRQSDIKALLEHAEKALKKIEAEYKVSLNDQSINTDLKIDIKNFCENLRSVLDYLAYEIREKYCQTSNKQDKFYFPILPDNSQFVARMQDWFPNLKKTHIDIWNYLEFIQPYNGENKRWLALFNRLNNENKHGALVEQVRKEQKEVRVNIKGGGRVSWTPKNVKFGRGVFIGGVPVDPNTQLPIPHHSQTVEQITWIDFKFEGIETSALVLLKQSFQGIKGIAEKIQEWI